ncbi:MAG: CHASE2 domain-containing protein [Planctomycetota bacterium]
MSKKALRRIAGPVLGFLAVVAGAGLSATGALDRLEGLSFNARARALARAAPKDLPIRLVLIDDASIARVAEEREMPWRWPREYFAAILAYLREDQARAIVCDLDFLDPSPFGTEDDRKLHDVLKTTPRVVLPLRLKGDARKWPEPPPEVKRGGLGGVESVPYATFSDPEVVSGTGVRYGHVVADEDSGGRRVRALYEFDGHLLPQLGLAAFLATEDGTLAEVPRDAEGNLLLRYRRPDPATGHLYEAFSAAGILDDFANGVPPSGRYRDCYVLLGASAENLFDNWPTPVKEVAPGVEIHATVLDNLLRGEFLRPAPGALTAALAFAICAGTAWFIVRARTVRGTVLGAAVALPLPACLGMAAYACGLAAPVVWPTVSLALAALAAAAVNYVSEGRQRQYLRRAFEHYLSPAVISRIVEDPSRLRLGGERRELSILFADLEGFTALSERIEPQELSLFLNRYLGEMTEIVLAEEGTLDKYLGDAIVAFWNAPLDQGDHATRAVRAALRCQRRLAEMRPELGRDVRMRIGVHTGIATVGNFGSRHRFDYTVLGDAPNLASRLEGANKHFGTGLLVSEATWEAVRGAFAGRLLGRLRVVGRSAPVRVYEPVALEGEPAPPLLAVFEEARRRCEAADWHAAAEALAASSDDPVARVWLDRVRALQRDHATSWTDDWTLDSK